MGSARIRSLDVPGGVPGSHKNYFAMGNAVFPEYQDHGVESGGFLGVCGEAIDVEVGYVAHK